MIELMPASWYRPVFLVVSVILTIVYYDKLNNGINLKTDKRNAWGIMLPYAILFIIFVGLRPVNGYYFGDTGNYALGYQHAKSTPLFLWTSGRSERVFGYLMWACSKVMPVQWFFLIVEILYIVPMIVAVRKLAPNESGAMLLFAMTSFSFFTYGTNGIRNGMACSLIILAIALLSDRNLLGYIGAAVLATIAFGCHRSTALPILCSAVCLFYKNTKGIIAFWVFSIFISLVAGGPVESFFTGLGFDDRMVSYGSANVNEAYFSHTGFRWDFLLYSCVPILLGWYVIVERGLEDATYSFLLNTYILCNSFWVMMIRASYSNRFAYLSWFLYPIVLAYPLLRLKVFKEDNDWKVALILVANTAFTVIMSL